MNWPIGTDGDFKGVYNRKLSQIELFEGAITAKPLSPQLKAALMTRYLQTFSEIITTKSSVKI